VSRKISNDVVVIKSKAEMQERAAVAAKFLAQRRYLSIAQIEKILRIAFRLG